MNLRSIKRLSSGFALLEVLVTIVILAFGLLGLVGLQSKMQLAETESYQRAQAVVLLSDMAERMSTKNPATVSSYGADNAMVTLGTGVDDTANCAVAAPGPARDMCEWSQALKGTSETVGSVNYGAMIGARGCIELVRAAAPATCTPAVYRMTVAWQGLSSTAGGTSDTARSNLTCGQGTSNYGSDDSFRRVLSKQVVIPSLSCVPS